MRCGLLATTLLGVCVAQTALGGRALAATPVPVPAPQAAPPAAPAPAKPAHAPAPPPPAAAPAPAPAPPPGHPYAPPPGYPQPYPPPAYAPYPPPAAASPWTAPPGYYYYYGYPQRPAVPDLTLAMASYQSAKRSHGIAVLCEFLLPGIGSIYADHVNGALITWGLMLAGVVFLVYGITGFGDYEDRREGYREDDDDRIAFGLGFGLALFAAGRVYGFVDAWRSTTRYNDGLRLRLGLPPQYAHDLRAPHNPRAQPRLVGPRLAFTF
jgi:hypothetical protein